VKRILLEIFVYSFSLYFSTLMYSGLVLSGGFEALVIGGVLLAIGFLIVKPILNIISFPFNFITLWLFSFLTSAIILLLVTSLYTKIKIHAFTFQGGSLLGTPIPRVHLNIFLSYVVISVTISVVSKLLLWLNE